MNNTPKPWPQLPAESVAIDKSRKNPLVLKPGYVISGRGHAIKIDHKFHDGAYLRAQAEMKKSSQ